MLGLPGLACETLIKLDRYETVIRYLAKAKESVAASFQSLPLYKLNSSLRSKR